MKQKIFYFSSILCLIISIFIACDKKNDNNSNNQTYSFTSSSLTRITGDSVTTSSLSTQSAGNNTICTSIYCVTPTAVSGKYFGVGLMIQSNGNGMNAYFGADSWGNITGTSTTYDFNSAAPISNSNNLTCCTGSGDLSSSNTYFSDVQYLMAYVDVTFTIAASAAHAPALGTHTIRFVLADNVFAEAKRGDLLYKDTDTAFKWVDSNTGSMSTTRPSQPVTQNTAVVNYVSPYPEGNQIIPVIYAGIESKDANGAPLTVSEEQLKSNSKTYKFNFNTKDLVAFPTLIKNQDEGMLNTIKDLMQRVHLQGLPFSGTGAIMGAAPNATLTIE